MMIFCVDISHSEQIKNGSQRWEPGSEKSLKTPLNQIRVFVIGVL
jgi:hypothetical protein